MKSVATLFLASIISASAIASTGGIVVSSDGTPLAGAKVSVYRVESSRSQKARLSAGRPREPLTTVSSGKDGLFEFDVKAGGVVELVVEHEGQAPAIEHILAGDTETAVELRSAAARAGAVRAGGRPVAGARVIAIAGNSEVWSSITGPEGRFSIPEPRGWCSRLLVLHPDFARLEVDTESGSELPLDLTLLPGTEASGTVVDENGSPVAGARLSADGWPAGVSAEDGRFTIRHLATQSAKIAATSPDGHGIAVRANGTLTVTIRADGSVAGTVIDAKRRPLPGAVVMIYDSRESTEFAVSGDDGAYRLDGLEAGEMNVGVSLSPGLRFELAEVKVRAGQTGRADLTGRESEWIRGTVVDLQRRPVVGATVAYLGPQMPIAYGISLQPLLSARSGVEGKFRLHYFPQFGEGLPGLRLQASRSGYAAATVKADASRTTTITLPPGTELHGLVVDGTGQPVPGAGVVAVQDPFGGTTLPLDAAMSSGAAHPFVTSDSEGRFVIHLNDAPHDIGVWKSGYAGFRASDVRPIAGAAPLRVLLEPGARLRGKVTQKGAEGPVSGTVIASGEDGSSGSARIEPDGSFTLASLRRGSYLLQYTGPGGQATRRATAPADDVVIELAPQGQVRVLARDDATGMPITTFTVTVSGPAGFSYETAERTDGVTISRGGGSADFTVEAEGYVNASRSVNVEEGKSIELTLRLSPGRSIAGRVLSEKGGPVAGARVNITDASVDTFESAETAEDGTFQVGGLPAEELEISVSHTAHATRKLALEAGGAITLPDIVLSRGRTLNGRVVTSRGEPVAEAMVWARGEETKQTNTDESGRFRIEGIGEANLTVSARHAEHGSGEVENADLSKEVVVRMKDPALTGTIRGKVHGFAGGEWIMGRVTAGSEQAMLARDGSYRLEHVNAGEVAVRAQVGSAFDQRSTPPVNVTVVPGAEAEANLSLDEGSVIRGVVSFGGLPAPGLTVVFSRDGEGWWSTSTRDGGSYAVSGLEPGLYEVQVSGARIPYSTRYRVGGSATFDIAVDAQQIAGRVVDEKGTPLAGAEVSAVNEDDHGSAGTAKTDASGAFTFAAPARPLVVSATLKGYATAVQRVGSNPPPLLLTLAKSEGIRVRLLDARSGATIDGWAVASDSTGLIFGRAGQQQKDGSFVVPVAPGDYRLSVSANGFASQSVQVTAPSTSEVRMALTPGGTLVVSTPDAQNDLVKLLMPGGAEYVRCQCNGIAEIRLTGSITKIDNVAPGTYTLLLLDDGGNRLATHTVNVTEGGTTQVEVHLPR